MVQVKLDLRLIRPGSDKIYRAIVTLGGGTISRNQFSTHGIKFYRDSKYLSFFPAFSFVPRKFHFTCRM